LFVDTTNITCFFSFPIVSNNFFGNYPNLSNVSLIDKSPNTILFLHGFKITFATQYDLQRFNPNLLRYIRFCFHLVFWVKVLLLHDSAPLFLLSNPSFHLLQSSYFIFISSIYLYEMFGIFCNYSIYKMSS